MGARVSAAAANITVQFAVNDATIPAAQSFINWAELTLLHVGHPMTSEIVIRITDEKESASLNARWRKKEHPTNVLSFPAEMHTMPIPILGDVVICAPVVQREALEQQKPVTAHWAHMAIHGVLHLLGYDHIDADDMQKMEALEVAILNKLHFPNPYIVEAH